MTKKAVVSQKTLEIKKFGPIRLVPTMWVAMGKEVVICFRILFSPEGFPLMLLLENLVFIKTTGLIND